MTKYYYDIIEREERSSVEREERSSVLRQAQQFDKDVDLFTLIHEGNYKAVHNALIIKGIDINLKNGKNQTLLHYAVLYHQLKIAQFLIDKGANLNLADNLGITPRQINYVPGTI